jgi:hypothetical protein
MREMKDVQTYQVSCTSFLQGLFSHTTSILLKSGWTLYYVTKTLFKIMYMRSESNFSVPTNPWRSLTSFLLFQNAEEIPPSTQQSFQPAAI